MSLLCSLGLQAKAKVVPDHYYPLAKSLISKIENNAFLEAELLLKKASTDNRERLIESAASSVNGLHAAIRWTEQNPKSAYANHLAGVAFIIHGWRVRGSGYAETVDKPAWEEFFKYLESAEEYLILAAKLDPELPDPYAWLLHSGMGLSAEPDVLYARFLEATNRDQWNFSAYFKYFSTITEKWGGSHNQMYAFAREASLNAAKGSAIHILIPTAYMETALAARDESLSIAYKKLRNKSAASETVQALYKWLDATPENLIDKLNIRSDPFAFYGLNAFACALYMTGAFREAHAVLNALSGEIYESPWAWISKGLRERFDTGFVYDRIYRETKRKIHA